MNRKSKTTKVKKDTEFDSMKANSSLIFILLFIFVGVVILLYFLYFRFKPFQIIEYSGYAVSGNKLTENLLNKKFNDENDVIKAVKIEEQDMIYKRLNSYYVGKEHMSNINLDYPIYINNNLALFNLSEDVTLITKNFLSIQGHPNFTLTSGIKYNLNDLTRADFNDYIFLKSSNKICVNTKELKINTTLYEYIIPMNSIIYFNNEYIALYKIEGDSFKYQRISDIDDNSKITIDDMTLAYKDLLLKLGLEKAEISEIENNAVSDIVNQIEISDEEFEQKDKIVIDEETYVPPEVTLDQFTANVYYITSKLDINDPSGVITSPIEITITKNGKKYLMKSYKSSGNIEISGLAPGSEYEITAKYNYLDEDGNKRIREFFSQKITTKDFDILNPISIEFRNGKTYKNKIEIADIKIVSDLKDEALKGVKSAEIVINNVSYKIPVSAINSLLRGEAITYQTSEAFTSNSKYQFEINIYDISGNKFNVLNNKGEATTSKTDPTVGIKVSKKDPTLIDIGLTLSNKDDVKISNYRYELLTLDGQIVSSDQLEIKNVTLSFDNLNPNEYYIIRVYADYDLEDGDGVHANALIGETSFLTVPLSTLGVFNLNTELIELTTTNAKIKLSVNTDITDNRLLKILYSCNVSLVDENDTNTYSIDLNEEQISIIKQGEAIELNFDALSSNTKYYLKITLNAKQGTHIETINTKYSIEEFITMKRPAKVNIRNMFVTGSIIDFDLMIEDPDIAVLNQKARVELRDENDKLISLTEIGTNQEYQRMIYDKLVENHNYKLSIYVDEYNEGHDNLTYKSNYLLFEQTILTVPGIEGSIDLTDLLRKPKGKNLIDVKSDVKWYSKTFNTDSTYYKNYNEQEEILRLHNGGSNNYAQIYSYNLTDYIGQTVTISFKAKMTTTAGTSMYFENKKEPTRSGTKVNVNSSNWQEFEYTVTVNNSGYLGFYIQSGNNNPVQIKDMQVELGEEKTSYEKFIYDLNSSFEINLIDSRDEIETNDYYVLIYKNDELISTNRYEEIDDTNKVVASIKDYLLDEGEEYKVELAIRAKDRYHVLDSITFSTDKEILGIRNRDQFLEIQPQGKYFVLDNIDLSGLTGNSIHYSSNITFQGEINFLGNSLTRDRSTSTNVFQNIGIQGIIENMVFNISLNNEIETSNFNGLCTYNYGTIRGIIVNLLEATQVPNIRYRLIGYANYGLLENFVINLQDTLYGQSEITGGFSVVNGTIRNGYVYGKDMKVKFSNVVSAPVALTVNQTGTVENVYSLVNVNSENPTSSDLISNIIGTVNYGTIRNVYSLGSGNTTLLTRGPNIASVSGYTKISNSYYFDDRTFNNSYNKKASYTSLHDVKFQNSMLNVYDAFLVDDLVTKGYYPQVKLDDSMPAQEYIQLPLLTQSDYIDVTSSRLIEQVSNSKAVIQVSVYNPAGEEITGITFKDFNDENVKIVSQEYSEGQSNVTIELQNPIRSLSKYSIMSVTSSGAFGIPSTRSYKENERVIDADFYREINNVTDWKNISKSPTENYILMQDLDFINEGSSILITTTYSGKINGNNKTIKNIIVPGNYKGLFSTLSGTIGNLFIENYTHSEISSNSDNGFIGTASSNAKIDNVHIKGMEMTAIKNNSTLYVGGLVGNATNTTISNSSVSDIKFSIEDKSVSLAFGGILGYGTFINVSNCFVQGIDFNAIDVYQITGIGGLIGRETNAYSTVINCYTTGTLYTNNGYSMGGIIGYTNGAMTIDKCYSTVNISGTSNSSIAGIRGYGTGTNTTQHCLYLGDMYSYNINPTTRRIVGTVNSSYTNNYAYQDQLINGYSTTELGGADKLLSYDEIFYKSTYIDLLEFENIYDYSGLENGILPKLYYGDGSQLLPNQKDTTIQRSQDRTFEIEPIDYKTQVNKTPNDATIQLIISNPSEAQITGVEIESMNITRQVISTRNQKTIINLDLKPEKYYDTYKITKIKYIEGEEEKEYNVAYLLKLQFFKEIHNVDEWQAIDPDSSENYKLLGDLDFKGVKANYNLKIGRLEADTTHTIKNLTLNLTKDYDCFINTAFYSIKNIDFEDITITSKASYNSLFGFIKSLGSSNAGISNINFRRVKHTGSGTYKSLFDNVSTTMNNITFDDVEISSKGYSYVGPVRYISSSATNITLNNIRCYGNTNVGGFTANGVSTTNTVTGKDITIESSSYYVGAVNGSGGTVTKATLEDVNVKGSYYVGGVSGSGTVSNSSIKNSIIKANTTNTGGIAGSGGGANNTVVNCEISGTNNIGGISGTSGSALTGCFVSDSTITGVTAVAGISGYLSGYVQNSGVINTQIKGTGSQVGGIVGHASGSRTSATSATIQSSYTKDCSITGDISVGGIAGQLTAGSISFTYNDANVVATTRNAAGILGYLNNTNMTAISYISGIYKNYVADATITAPTNVGGVVGNTAVDLYNDTRYTSNFVDADLNTDTQDVNISIGIGGRKEQNINLSKTYFTKYSKLNGQYVDTANDNFDATHALDRSSLESQTTYTSLMGWSTTYFDFSSLSNDKYPLLKNVKNQVGIDLPEDINTLNQMSVLGTRSLFSLHNGIKVLNSKLPNLKTYVTDIDKINLEFDNIDTNSYFSYKIGDSDSKKISIDKNVYTFEYDFITPIEVTISNGISSNIITLNPNEIYNNILNFGDEYLYITDNKLYSNIRTIDGDFVNLHNDKVLSKEGVIYDLNTLDSIGNINKGTFNMLDESVAIQSFEYQGTKIDTYLNFSNITSDNKTLQRELLIYLKNSRLFLFDPTLDIVPGKVIVDNFNNNEYQTILSSNGKLYDLKTPLNYPDDFKNSKIKNITSNIQSNNQNLVVYYESGRVYVFNYVTGEVIYDNQVKEDISFFSYLFNNLELNNSNSYEDIEEKYTKSRELVSKLEEKPINSAASELGILDKIYPNNSNVSSNSLHNIKYATVYDNVNDKYVVYNESEILQTSQEEIKTENSKIDNNQDLSDYYENDNMKKSNISVSGYILIGISITAILIILVILSKKK